MPIRGLGNGLTYSWESLWPHTCSGLYTCSQKTWENLKLTPLTDFEVLCNQEVKTIAEN